MTIEQRLQFRCSECNQRVSAPTHSAGKRAKCPACGKVVTVPSGVSQMKRTPLPIEPTCNNYTQSEEPTTDGIREYDPDYLADGSLRCKPPYCYYQWSDGTCPQVCQGS